ncbi:MAG: zf-TFIIB domain-containing protein [Candidatus Nanoarchaeia archaeon]
MVKKTSSKKSDNIISCPKCSNFFNTYKLRKIKHPAGVILDVCDRCNGLWIDGPEVEILNIKNVKGGKKWENKKRG